MSNITVFSFNENELRTLIINEEVWFVAKDVCGILGTDVRDITKILDEDERGVDTIHTLGGMQKMVIISESGLYGLVLKSRKGNAKPFQRWVRKEVLPNIRKKGFYGIQDANKFPELWKHSQRVELNIGKIPYTHFSMLGEMELRILKTLKVRGFDLIPNSLPDGSLGKGFCKYLKEEIGIDTNVFNTYTHEYPDGRKVEAKLYPNELYHYLQNFINEIWINGNGAKYFKEQPKQLK